MRNRPMSIIRDAFAFEGKSGRMEFLLKFAFWQLAFPVLVLALVSLSPWTVPRATPFVLLLAGNLTFLLPVATRRARDAGMPAVAFLTCFILVILAFIIEGRPWGYLACLALLSVAPSRRPKPFLLTQEMRVFPS